VLINWEEINDNLALYLTSPKQYNRELAKVAASSFSNKIEQFRKILNSNPVVKQQFITFKLIEILRLGASGVILNRNVAALLRTLHSTVSF